jgi:hypothetical protein
MTITKPITAVLLTLLGTLFFGPADLAVAQIAIEIAPRIEMTPGDFARIDPSRGFETSDPGLAAALNQLHIKTARGLDLGALNNSSHVKASGEAVPPDVPPVVSRGKSDDCASKLTKDDLQTLQRSLRATRNSFFIDDAIQEAVIAYLDQCRKGIVIGNPDRWLFVTAKNKLFNIHRGEQTRSKIEGSALSSPTD